MACNESWGQIWGQSRNRCFSGLRNETFYTVDISASQPIQGLDKTLDMRRGERRNIMTVFKASCLVSVHMLLVLWVKNWRLALIICNLDINMFLYCFFLLISKFITSSSLPHNLPSVQIYHRVFCRLHGIHHKRDLKPARGNMIEEVGQVEGRVVANLLIFLHCFAMFDVVSLSYIV